ncbi:hypothetical protein BFW01_g5853 [Lasiodiplodia theobromae]|nr:hypothetical protein BFW01_g5853 [Lasiodiplodia theobromae]
MGVQTDAASVKDVEKEPFPDYQNKEASIQEPQLNVGGHGGTQRRLRNYQVTMIGFSSGIGTGLFIGTGSAYAKAGPAGLLLAYLVIGSVLWCVMQSIGELATVIPTAGSFPHWATRFIDPAVGFSLAISYGYCYTIAIASECSAAAVLVSFWTDISPAVVITISLNAYCWVGSRMIVAMTTDHQLPQVFGRTNKHGVPYVAVIVAWLFGPLAYLSLGSGGASQAFTWLLNLSTVAGLIAWATLCFCYIRFHRAMAVQGVPRETLPWRAPWQPYAAWYGFVGSVIITLVAGFPVFLKGNWNAADFVASYVGIPIFIVPIVCWKLWHKTTFVRAKNIDLWSGRLPPAEKVETKEPETLWEKFVDWLV